MKLIGIIVIVTLISVPIAAFLAYHAVYGLTGGIMNWGIFLITFGASSVIFMTFDAKNNTPGCVFWAAIIAAGSGLL